MAEIENMLDVSPTKPFQIDKKLLGDGIIDKEFFTSELISIETVQNLANDAGKEMEVHSEIEDKALDKNKDSSQQSMDASELITDEENNFSEFFSDESVNNRKKKSVVKSDSVKKINSSKGAKERREKTAKSSSESRLSLEEHTDDDTEKKSEDNGTPTKSSESEKQEKSPMKLKSIVIKRSNTEVEEDPVLVLSETDQSISENEHISLESTLECINQSATSSQDVLITDTANQSNVNRSDVFSSEEEITIIHLGKDRQIIAGSDTDDDKISKDSFECKDRLLKDEDLNAQRKCTKHNENKNKKNGDRISQTTDVEVRTENSPVRTKRKKKHSKASDSSVDSQITEESELDKTEKYVGGVPFKSPSSSFKKYLSQSADSLNSEAESFQEPQLKEENYFGDVEKSDSPRQLYKKVIDEIKKIPDRGPVKENELTDTSKCSETPVKFSANDEMAFENRNSAKSSEKKSLKRTPEETEFSEQKTISLPKKSIEEKFLVKALKKTPRKKETVSELAVKKVSGSMEEFNKTLIINISEHCNTADSEANAEEITAQNRSGRLSAKKMFENLSSVMQIDRMYDSEKDDSEESQSKQEKCFGETSDTCIEIASQSDDETETETETKYSFHTEESSRLGHKDDLVEYQTELARNDEGKNDSGSCISKPDTASKQEAISGTLPIQLVGKTMDDGNNATDKNESMTSVIDLVSDTEGKEEKVELEMKLNQQTPKKTSTAVIVNSDFRRKSPKMAAANTDNRLENIPVKSAGKQSPRSVTIYNLRSPNKVEPTGIDSSDIIIPSSERKFHTLKRISNPELEQKKLDETTMDTESESDVEIVPNLAQHLKSPHIPVTADDTFIERECKIKNLRSKEVMSTPEGNFDFGPSARKQRKSSDKKEREYYHGKVTEPKEEQSDIFEFHSETEQLGSEIRKTRRSILKSVGNPDKTAEEYGAKQKVYKTRHHKSASEEIATASEETAAVFHSARKTVSYTVSETEAMISEKLAGKEASSYKLTFPRKSMSPKSVGIQNELREKRKSVSNTGLKTEGDHQKSSPPRRRSERKVSASTSKKNSPKKIEAVKKSSRKRRLLSEFSGSDPGSITDDPEISFPKIKKVIIMYLI